MTDLVGPMLSIIIYKGKRNRRKVSSKSGLLGIIKNSKSNPKKRNNKSLKKRKTIIVILEMKKIAMPKKCIGN